MKNSLILASLLAMSSLTFAAAPAAPASTPAPKKAADNVAAAKQYQRTRSLNKALHMRGIHRPVTPRVPAKAASSAK